MIGTVAGNSLARVAYDKLVVLTLPSLREKLSSKANIVATAKSTKQLMLTKQHQ